MLGYFLALVTMFIYGMYPVVSHYLVSDIDPIFLIGIVSIVASIPFLLYLIPRNKQKDLFSIRFRKLFIEIALLAAAANALFFIGTKMTSGLNTSLLLQVEPIYSVILAFIFLGEKIKKREILSIIVMVIGAVVVAYKGGQGLNIGDIFIIITPLLYQAYHMRAKQIMTQGGSANMVAAGRLLYGGIILLFIALVVHPESILILTNVTKVWKMLLFGLLLSLNFFTWYQAVKLMPLSRASAFIPLSVSVSFLGSVFLLKEMPTSQHYVGLILILIGLIGLTWIHFKREKTQNTYEPEI